MTDQFRGVASAHAPQGLMRPATPAAVSQRALRAQNLAVVARHAFAHGPLSRAALAQATGLTRSTVSRLVDSMLSAEILRELDPLVQGRGRPATPLAPARRSLVGLGLEVSPSYLGGRLMDLAGDVVAETIEEGDFERSSPKRVLERLAVLAHGVLDAPAARGTRLVGTSLAVPGLVNGDGRVLRAPNLGWREVPVPDLLGFGGPGHLAVRNEADLAALAHAMAAPGRPAADSTFFYVSADIGVGGASVVAGVPATGGHGWAGEVGHTLVDPTGPACTCGAVGCLEQYAGWDALLRSAGLPKGTTAERLAEAAADGGAATAAVRRAGWALGIALANVVNLLDMADVVLGGRFIPLVELLKPAIEDELAVRVLASPWLTVRIRPGEADRPALTGGAVDALSEVVTNPARWVPDE